MNCAACDYTNPERTKFCHEYGTPRRPLAAESLWKRVHWRGVGFKTSCAGWVETRSMTSRRYNREPTARQYRSETG